MSSSGRPRNRARDRGGAAAGGTATAGGLVLTRLEGRAVALRRLAVAPVGDAAHADDTLVNGRLDRVVLLDVDLGQLVALDAGSLLDVTQRRGLDNVAHDEALDGLVLGDGLASRHAPHAVHVPTPLLVASVAAALDRHFRAFLLRERVRQRHAKDLAPF